jgi:hypothetical protein
MSDMTPQTTTAGQINKAISNFRALLEKHTPNFQADIVQDVLGDPEFAKAQFELLKTRIEARTGLRTMTLAKPFDFDSISEKTAKDLGRTFYGNADILLTCPKPVGIQEVSITLWEESGLLSCETLDARYMEKGLAPNPWHLVAFALMQPDFADKRAIATQWKDADGNFCYAVFNRWHDERKLSVHRDSVGWGGNCLFSGSGK